MSETINAVINNLSERFGDAVETLSPVVENVGAISQTVVQETANSGFLYTMVGLCFFGLAVVCVAILIWVMNCVHDKALRENIVGSIIIASIIFFIVGFCITMNNLSNWAAPTKQVIREIVETL